MKVQWRWKKEDGKAQEERSGVTDKSREMLLKLPSHSVPEPGTTLVGAGQ